MKNFIFLLLLVSCFCGIKFAQAINCVAFDNNNYAKAWGSGENFTPNDNQWVVNCSYPDQASAEQTYLSNLSPANEVNGD